MNKQSLSNHWYLITIVDPEFLVGKNIAKMLLFLNKTINFKYLILDYIYGTGKGIRLLEEKENEIITMDSIINNFSEITQFEWGDFFLFIDYPQNWDNLKGTAYPYVIAQSDTTVRAIDNQYIYIYTPYLEIVNSLRHNYQIESIKTNSLENLEYPE